MRRAVVVVLLLVLLLPVAVLLGAGFVLDSAAVRGRLVAALERATGHPVRVDGPVGLAWGLVPAVSVRDVAVLNGPGFSRPALATVRLAEARVALLPLLTGRVEVRGVALDGIDVLLERDAAGRANWAPDAVPAAAPAAGPGDRVAPGRRSPVEIGPLVVTNTLVALRGAPAVRVRRLEGTPSGGPVRGELVVNGVVVTLGGTAGPGPHLELTAAAPGLAAAVSGEVGGAMAVQVRADDLEVVSPLAGVALPPLRDVRFTAALPGPAAMRLSVGPSVVADGVTVREGVVEAGAFDQPLRVSLVGTVRELPVAVSAVAGSLAGLLARTAPVQVRVDADGGFLEASGSMEGATVSGWMPDLRRAGALAGVRLPALHTLAVEARVLPRPGGDGVLVRGLRVTAAEGDLAGDLALGRAPRPSARGSLVAQRLDVDAILAPAVTAPVPVVAPVPGPAPSPPISAPLPLTGLRQFDADLQVGVAQATWRGVAYRAIEARGVVQDGRLRLDPVRMTAPGGPVQGMLVVDAAAVPPSMSVALKAPALDVAPIAEAAGEAGAASGTVQLDLALRGAGADMAAVAATLDGHVAAALVDGEIENSVLVGLFGPALRAAKLSDEVGGRSRVRCMVVRADAKAGLVALPTLALDSTRLRLEGDGVVNLVDQTLDLHLRPSLKVGPTSVAVPVRLTGPIRAPRPAVEKGVVAPGRFGFTIGGTANDPCPAALAQMRVR